MVDKYSTSPKHWDTISAFLSSLYPGLPSSRSTVKKAQFVQSFHAPCTLEKFSIFHSLIIYFKKGKLMGKNNPTQCTGWLGEIQIFARSFFTQTIHKWINYASQIQLHQKLSLEGAGALSAHQSSLSHLKITYLRNKYLQTGHSSMKRSLADRFYAAAMWKDLLETVFGKHSNAPPFNNRETFFLLSLALFEI